MPSLMDDVGFLLSRTSGQVVRATNAALADEGLRVRHYSVLTLVTDAPPGVSQRDLAQLLGLDPSQVVLLVDELAGMDLVERRPSASDRRTKLVSATAKGRRLQRRAWGRASGCVRHELAALTDDEQATLKALLQRVVGRTAATGEEEDRALS